MKFLLILAVSLCSAPAFATLKAWSPLVVSCEVLGNTFDGYANPLLMAGAGRLVPPAQIDVGTYEGRHYVAQIGLDSWSLQITNAQGVVVASDSSPAAKGFADVIDQDLDAVFLCKAI